MKEDEITIGITAYREGKMLMRAVNAMLAQTSGNWKGYVVLDGGYDEETAEIARSISDPRVHVELGTENRGPYPTRETIFEMSANDIIIHCDADDELRPEAVEIVRDCFAQTDCAYAGFGAEQRFPDETTNIIPGRAVSIEDFVLKGMFPGYSLFRKSVWQKYGGYHRGLLRGRADFEFTLRLLAANEKFNYVSDIIINKHERTESVQTSYPTRAAAINDLIVKSNPNVFSNKNLKQEFLRAGLFRSAWAQYEAGNLTEASKLAVQYSELGSCRAVWPLHWQIPPIAKRSIAACRRFARGQRQRRQNVR